MTDTVQEQTARRDALDNPPVHWTDTLRELARYASDNELPAPIAIEVSEDAPNVVTVIVSGPAHSEWFVYFGEQHSADRYSGGRFHRSIGELPSSALVILHCSASNELPTEVAS